MVWKLPGGLFLADDEGAVLDQMMQAMVRAYARRDGMVPAQIRSIADGVHRCAVEYKANGQAKALFSTREDEETNAAGESGASDRLTVQQAAKRYGVTESYLYRKVREGALIRAESDDRNGVLLLDSASVAAWAAGRNRTKAA